MKIDINKLEFKSVSDNISLIYYDNKTLRFWTPLILAPFGIDNEYNKYLLKLEINEKIEEHLHLKKLLLHIENLIKKKLNMDDIEFKSIIKTRINNCDLIETRLKNIKNNITTIIEFEDKDNNYLKTVFDLKKQSQLKVQVEINGLWDYRNEKKDKNKCGLIIYITKIIVPK
jgi:uncharacterized protein (UPF0333 family)